MNGWSNSYYGWGGEDDDFYLRFKLAKKTLSRPSDSVGRFELAYHNESQQHNDKRWMLMNIAKNRGVQRQVSGLDNLKFNLIDIRTERFFVNITVDVQMTKKERSWTSVVVT